VAAKKVEKIRQLLGDLFDEMHLLFAPPLAPTNSGVAPGKKSALKPECPRLHC
jgi:hypothetical protein